GVCRSGDEGVLRLGAETSHSFLRRRRTDCRVYAHDGNCRGRPQAGRRPPAGRAAEQRVLNGKVADWVEQNVNMLWISCDGPPEFQDAQRPAVNGKPSSALVERNIKLFAAHPAMQV